MYTVLRIVRGEALLRLAGLALALLFIFRSGGAWAAEPDLARAEALIRAGQYAEAYRLLEPFEDKKAGDLKYDYLLARSALESGQPSKASFIYERILAIEPNYVGVRLEMGRAYFELRDFARAIGIFETVLRFQNLPPDLREQAQAYANAARQYLEARRTVRYGYVELSIGHDSNPLSATSVARIPLVDGSILVLPPSSLKRSDDYSAIAAGGEVVHAVTDRFSVYFGGDARGRGHPDIEAADFVSLDGRFGIGYNTGNASVRAGLSGGRYRLDGVSTRDNASLTIDGRYLAANRDLINFSFGGTGFRYLPGGLKVNDFDLFSVSVGWLRGINQGRGAIGITLLGGEEKAVRGRPDGDKPFGGIRLTLQNAFTDKVGGFIAAGAQSGKYDTRNPSFGIQRKDHLYDITVGVTWSFAPGWSLRGQVQYIRNDSNIPLFEFDRTDTSINLRKDF